MSNGAPAERRLAALRARLGRRTRRRIEEPGTIPAAVALVLAPAAGGNDLDLLLIERSRRSGDPWSGQMGLPGGRASPEDGGDLLRTAVRETQEETSVRLPREAALGELDDLHPRTRVLPPVVVRPFVFGLGERPPVRANPEVARHLWVPLERLAASLKEADVEVQGTTRREPAFVVGPHVVWGMTHRILLSFLELLD